MDSEQQQIAQVFLQEAQILLEDMEATLLKLEDSDEWDNATIDALFRIAHTFKGTSRLVGLSSICEVAHKMEDILDDIRKEIIPQEKKVFNLLFEGLDFLKNAVENLTDDINYEANNQKITSKLDSVLDENKCSLVPGSYEMLTGKVDIKDNESQNKQSHEKDNPTLINIETPPKNSGGYLRVEILKLDNLLNVIGELVVIKSTINDLRKSNRLNSKECEDAIIYLEKLIKDVQELAFSLRMTPIKPVFQKMKRIVRDLSLEQQKEINFITRGEHTELDKMVVEELSAPLTHLIRNAVDHGIEDKESRKKQGKPSKATVCLDAKQDNDSVTIQIYDDGRGIDPAIIAKKAIENGLIDNTEGMLEEDILNFIFCPGFSTNEEVTDISGRGVGMDVVRKSIGDLNGHIQIKSKIQKGSLFSLILPLSLSIIEGIIIRLDNIKYVVPSSHLIETITVNINEIQLLGGSTRIFNLRGENIPYEILSKIIHKVIPQQDKEDPQLENHLKPAIITLRNGNKISYEVDEILGNNEFVIKNIGNEFSNHEPILAGTILGDGEPALVLNLANIRSRRLKDAV